MCGVVAIYSYHQVAPAVDRHELRQIRDYMLARGPDGHGEWYSTDGRVGLGHRRLSIIDLSARAGQPMVSDDGCRILSYNGEIYNYRSLRQELVNKGHVFRSDSDTEVLLKLYEDRGEAMFGDLRGMYAFTIWDCIKQKLLLARDPYGIKPLYYADDGWTLRSASQVKALLVSNKVSRLPEPAGVVGFYLMGSVPEPYTSYQEIRSVPAGSFIWVDELGPGEPVQHYSIARTYRNAVKNSTDITDSSIQKQVRDIVQESVHYHLVSDVPVGAFLSAGVDSAALTGFAAECIRGSQSTGSVEKNIRTVTLTFDEYRNTNNDESILARTIADLYETEHTDRHVSQSEFESELPNFLQAMDQPTIDGINTWFVSKAVRETGLKVAISGIGGDELLGSYPSFSDVPRWVRNSRIPSRLPGLGMVIRSLLGCARLFMPQLHPKLDGLLTFTGDYPGAWYVRRGLFMPWELKSVMDRDLSIEGLRRLNLLDLIGKEVQPDPISPHARVATLESRLYLKNQLLRDTDWASMAHSLEVRTPLVDSKVLDAFSLISQAVVGGGGKRLLGMSPFPNLPESILNRKKTGFTVPVDIWLDRGKDMDIWKRIPSLRNSACHWSRRWAYTVLNAH